MKNLLMTGETKNGSLRPLGSRFQHSVTSYPPKLAEAPYEGIERQEVKEKINPAL